VPGDYLFGKRGLQCSACGHAFAAGEEYRSALVLEALPRAPRADPAAPAAAAGTDAAPGPDRPEPGPAAPAPGEAGLPLERLDLCAGCWDQSRAGEYFSSWKSTVPADEPEERRPLARRIDTETIYDLFRRLEGHADPLQQKFRFILALMLMRRKRLRFTAVVRAAHGEHLVLDDRDEGVTHKVLDPGLAEEEIDALRGQVDRLLGTADEEGEAPPPPAPGAVPPPGSAAPR